MESDSYVDFLKKVWIVLGLGFVFIGIFMIINYPDLFIALVVGSILIGFGGFTIYMMTTSLHNAGKNIKEDNKEEKEEEDWR